MELRNAVLYLRSSKDRSDASPDAQRRALKELAKQRGFAIVGEYVDAVESGKDENRPGFQRLIADVRNQKRGWDTVLVLDTSRVARRRQIALMFEEIECRKAGVQVVYKNLPDADPITEMLLKSILQAMDEWHSLTSRQKGLAGMAENIRQGFRAGGRAPYGYRLRTVATGAIRDGMPVTKSVLELDPDTHVGMSAFLNARADGMGRLEAARRAGLPHSASTLIGFEWNGLTYAGHTVWNVNAEAGSGKKRRPRSEWVIQKDTHPALIQEAQAEAILGAIEAVRAGRSPKRRSRDSGALLAGLLHTKAGAPWWAEGREYRCSVGRSSVSRAALDASVLAQIAKDLRSERMVEILMESGRSALAATGNAPLLAEVDRELANLERKADRLLELATDLEDPTPALRKIDESKARRVELALKRDELAEEANCAQAVGEVTDERLREFLRMPWSLFDEAEADSVRAALLSLVEQIVVDPLSKDVTIQYRESSRPIRGGARRSWLPLSRPAWPRAARPSRWSTYPPRPRRPRPSTSSSGTDTRSRHLRRPSNDPRQPSEDSPSCSRATCQIQIPSGPSPPALLIRNCPIHASQLRHRAEQPPRVCSPVAQDL